MKPIQLQTQGDEHAAGTPPGRDGGSALSGQQHRMRQVAAAPAEGHRLRRSSDLREAMFQLPRKRATLNSVCTRGERVAGDQLISLGVLTVHTRMSSTVTTSAAMRVLA